MNVLFPMNTRVSFKYNSVKNRGKRRYLTIKEIANNGDLLGEDNRIGWDNPNTNISKFRRFKRDLIQDLKIVRLGKG